MKLFNTAALVVLLLTSSVWMSAQAQNEKYARRVLETLCAPEMHGRGYVNGGDSLAAAYIADQYRQCGLKSFGSDYYQPFAFGVNTFPGVVDFSVGGIALKPGYDYVVEPTSGGLTARKDLLAVSFEDMEKGLLAERLRDKDFVDNHAILLDLSVVEDKKVQNEINVVARALTDFLPVVLVTSDKFTWGVGRESTKFPLVHVQSEVMPENPERCAFDIEAVWIPSHQTKNVIGYIEGTDEKKRKQFVVYSAHYDHLGRMGQETYFPGANDNASGMAILLSMVKHYSEHPPEHSIVFMSFAGEEAGLVGSKYYTDNPLFPLKKIKFLINTDIMGTGDEGIKVVNATEFPKAYETLVKLNDENDWLPAVKSRGKAANSDHYWFSENGVPAIFIYTLGGVSHYHDVYDRAETLPLSEYPDLFRLLTAFVNTF